jgi:hypothetical protein
MSVRKVEFEFELEINMRMMQDLLKPLSKLHSVSGEDRYQYELR